MTTVDGPPRPYYDEDGITIYHGDCREIDAWLRSDVLVTDPPYGMAYVSSRSAAGPSDAIAGDATTDLRDYVLNAWGERPALAFGTWKVPKPANIRHLAVWDKGDDPGTGDLTMPWGNSYEEIYIIGKGWTGKRQSNVLRFPTPRGNTRPNHPTPKPKALMLSLLAYAPPGIIADPFVGSGTTLVAAKELGRRAIGIEIEERYCEIAAKRLAQGVLDFGEAS